jgi:hypothetical protein
MGRINFSEEHIFYIGSKYASNMHAENVPWNNFFVQKL